MGLFSTEHDATRDWRFDGVPVNARGRLLDSGGVDSNALVYANEDQSKGNWLLKSGMDKRMS